MANQTITTAVNYDDASISGLLNGETITNNGGFLTINADVRWNQQAAVFGSITCSATLGGSVLIDGTQIWEISFDSSTGNVPTQAALGSNGVLGGSSGATGELTRVWAAGSLTPATAGTAMPTSGFIKLRSKTGTFQDNEIITLPGGATVTVNSATGGKRSWIHLVGNEGTNITSSRLGTTNLTGDWYELGTTNGSDDQTFQFPVSDYCPAIQVETGVGTGVYEWWLYGADGIRWGTSTQYIATDVRGKYFGIDPATGIITIARRASNPCGFKPVSGLRVRIPNLICSNSNSANWNANTWNTSSINTRHSGVNTTNNPSVTIDKITCNWRWSMTSANNITFTNCGLMPSVSITSPTGTLSIDFVAIGLMPASFTSTSMLAINNCNSGTISNLRVARQINDGSLDSAITISTSNNLVLANIQAEIFGAAGSAVRSASSLGSSFTASRCSNFTMTNLTAIGGPAQMNTFLSATSLTGYAYADSLVGSTQTSVSTQPGLSIFTCTNFTFTGPFTNFGGLTNVHPYNNLFNIGTANTNGVIQNVGTSSSPYDCANITGQLVNITSSDNLIVRRCYVQNTRNASSFGVASEVTNCSIDNCGGDYTDTTAVGGQNTRVRGFKSLNTTTGSSAAAGTHYNDWFTSATTGRIVFTGNEPSASSGSQFSATLGPGSGYSGSGSIVMVNLNDTVTYETAYFILGHTQFQNTSPTFTGTNSANFTIDFQYDLGSGWNGTWLSATGTNLSGIGAINPAIGIKLKLRATVNTASTTNALTFIRLDTNTTAIDQDTLYPFPFDGSGIISNISAGSRIQIYNDTTDTELVNQDVPGTTFTYEYYVGTQVSLGDTIRIRLSKLGKLPQTLLATGTNSGFSAVANQLNDNIYILNGISGNTVTEFTADYPNVQIDINDPDGQTTVQRIYAWMRYIETTSNGISLWFDSITASDDVNYEIDASVINLKVDNVTGSPVRITGGRLYKSDQSTIIAATSGSVQMDPGRVYSYAGALTAQDVWDYGERSLTNASVVSTTVWNANTATFGNTFTAGGTLNTIKTTTDLIPAIV
jgi:hypothetical protein